MRFVFLVLLVYLWSSAKLLAQNKQLLYDFTNIPDALMTNPGMLTDYQWYASIPVVSGLSFQAGSNDITVHDLFADDGLDFNDKVRERAIYGMEVKDELSGTYQIALLYAGFRGRNSDNFYSFGIYNEADAVGYWFKDYAILAFEGNADQLGRKFNVDHLKTRGEMVNVFHFGINKTISSNLTIGARAKIYSSVFNFTSTNNKGYFVTTEGQNNLRANTLVADMEFRSSGLNEIEDALDNDSSLLPGILTRRMFFGGDLGLGLDLGFTYNLNERTVVTGSVLDLGFIYNTTDVKNYTLRGSATVEGIEAILPDSFSNANDDFWQDLVDEVDALLPHGTNTKSYLSFRPTKVYGSLRYNFGKPIPSRRICDCKDYVFKGQDQVWYNNAVGGQLYVINRPRGPQAALTAFYLRRFGNTMALKTTYTVDKFSYSNIGIGLNVQAGVVSLYVMADNLLGYKNIADSHYASFQFGLNIISWGKK
ncbi:hypothetical protein KCTC52924_02069 [Arenibacter antarcticus]|uniref:DUF5723 family protein n=1 Tax=Arenibacter antarcticus TaxID=2040469 RepID=A0ABW5VGP4_9FLAO|nr:DUF5723 family protein [Arenibacter sp. H213]MCM4168494.1 hypothetical protein [Arenibacter sp. H213]